MPLFDPHVASAAANGDAEFKLAARFWTATLRLDVGDQPYLLKLRDGVMASFNPVTPPEAGKHDLNIAAPESDWRELLQPVPRPFYQDLMAARLRHNFTVEGDLLGFNPYYRAFNRLIQLMRLPAH
jgi:hypothetical protein